MVWLQHPNLIRIPKINPPSDINPNIKILKRFLNQPNLPIQLILTIRKHKDRQFLPTLSLKRQQPHNLFRLIPIKNQNTLILLTELQKRTSRNLLYNKTL